MEAVPCGSLADICNIDEFDCIGIDEGQFFPDLVSWCEACANRGKVVIVAALDGDYQRRPFGPVLHLVPLAEDVCKLTAVCMRCHQPASFSQKLVLSAAESVVDIGGAEKYRAVCRTCFFTEHTEDAVPVTPSRVSPVSLSKPTFSPR
jgi:thymidine kinase